MRALILIGCIILFLFLIGQIRVGVSVRYTEAGLFAAIRVGVFRIQLLPAKKAGEKKEKGTKQREKKPKDRAKSAGPKKKAGDTLALAMRFLPLLGEAAGQLKRKIKIDRLFLHVIWAAENPASAAMGFGAGNAALGMLWPILENNFKVGARDLSVDVDFQRTKPAVDVDAQATLTIGQGLVLGISLGIKVLKIYLGFRREQIEQKAVQQ